MDRRGSGFGGRSGFGSRNSVWSNRGGGGYSQQRVRNYDQGSSTARNYPPRGAPTVNVNVSNQGQGQRSAPPRAAAAPAQQAAPRLSEEQLQVIKATQTDLFNETCRLVLLPGGFPLCYASGDCLITNYTTWMKYRSDACYTQAKRLVLHEDSDAPFTWGFRPLPPAALSSISNPETVAWAWSFVLANIAPIPGAVDVFIAGVSAGLSDEFVASVNSKYPHAREDGQDWTKINITQDFREMIANDDMLEQNVYISIFANLLRLGIQTHDNTLDPGELAEFFKTGSVRDGADVEGRIRNLLEFQRFDRNQARFDTVRETVDAARREAASGFISEDDGQEQDESSLPGTAPAAAAPVIPRSGVRRQLQ